MNSSNSASRPPSGEINPSVAKEKNDATCTKLKMGSFPAKPMEISPPKSRQVSSQPKPNTDQPQIPARMNPSPVHPRIDLTQVESNVKSPAATKLSMAPTQVDPRLKPSPAKSSVQDHAPPAGTPNLTPSPGNPYTNTSPTSVNRRKSSSPSKPSDDSVDPAPPIRPKIMKLDSIVLTRSSIQVDFGYQVVTRQADSECGLFVSEVCSLLSSN